MFYHYYNYNCTLTRPANTSEKPALAREAALRNIFRNHLINAVKNYNLTLDSSDNHKECNDGNKYQGRTFRRVALTSPQTDIIVRMTSQTT